MSEIKERIGNIRLAETLGEGGMGTVWAGYDEKLRREVAVKTIRGDRVDLETRARLLAEARILSQLDHPNICRLYDYVEGEDSDYLVLERIRGRTLAEAMASELGGADKLRLGNAEKLRIAEDIARTLVVAHARGIVHRDLKPSNVMLAENGDGRPGRDRHEQLKVLDFGLARSLDRPEVESSANRPAASGGSASRDAGVPAGGTLTRLGSIVLRGEAGRVTGTLANMSPEQARGERVTPASDIYSFGLLLQELFTGSSAYPPDLPADRLLTKVAAGDTLPVAGVDQDVKALIERLKAHAPEERPAASEAVARLRRIRDRPKRRRRWLAAAAIIAAFATGGVKYVLDQKRERDRTQEARQEAEQTTAFLTDLFVAADPWQRQGGELTVREVLDQGRDRIADELADQPRIRGRLLTTLGHVYEGLNLFPQAEALFEEALEVNETVFGPESAEVAESLHWLGIVIHRQDRLEDAEPLYRRALEIHEAGPGQQPIAMAGILLDLANIYSLRGERARPERLYQRGLGIMESQPDPDHPNLSRLLVGAGTHYRVYGDEVRSEALLKRGLEIKERQSESASTIEVLNALALIYTNWGDLARAEPLYARALEIGERLLMKPGDWLMSATRNNFALLLLSAGELQRAESLLGNVIENSIESLGAKHPYVVVYSFNLGRVYVKQGRYEEAEPILRKAFDNWTEARSDTHPRAGKILSILATVRWARGAPEEAEALFERAAGILSEALGNDDPYLTDCRLHLGSFVLEHGDRDRALELHQLAGESTRRRLAENPGNISDQGRLAAVSLGLGSVAAARGAGEEAEAHWREALAILEPLDAGRVPAELLQTRALALLYLGRTETARPVVESLVAKGWHDRELHRQARASGLLADAE